MEKIKTLTSEIKALNKAISTVESLKGSIIEYCGNEFILNDNSVETASDINTFFDDASFAFTVKAEVAFSYIKFCVYEKATEKDAFADTTLLYYSNFDKGSNFTDVINRRLDKLHKKLDKTIDQLDRYIDYKGKEV